MAEIDHLIFAAPDVDEGVRRIAAATGVDAVPGGPHVGLGTHNHLLTFDDRTYFEIIGIDPDQPAPARPRPFGLDERDEPGLAGYAIHPTGSETLEDVAERIRSVGLDPGDIAEMSRRKPDGETISWRLTIGGDSGVTNDGAVPFAIEWGDTSSPAVSLPSMGRLVALRVSHPESVVREAVAALDIGVELIDGPAALVAVVETAAGATVEIA